MLFARLFHVEQRQKPWLVFLHGLLGNHHDWDNVITNFSDFPCLAVDLPGHGQSRATSVVDFAGFNCLFTDLLKTHEVESYYLIGYSLGGRLAMHYTCTNETVKPCGLFIESAHPGLTNADEKMARCTHDAQWALRFRQEPMEKVLRDWYQQPVFADLSISARATRIAERRDNDGQGVAALLTATSLGKQPDLAPKLRALRQPLFYVCGERDQKFSTLATSFPHRIITHAGHNVHADNPQAFCQQLRSFITPI